jgi:NAD(P)-dependent dehydrogenase (short-subunit alcohol dehydrogenase family)
MDLAGKNALVTGVSRRAGIGFAIARRLQEGGASVFVQGWSPHDVAQGYTDADGTESVARELGIGHLEADFAGADAPRHVVDAAREHLGGPLDVLVVNHARSGGGRLAETTAALLDAFFAENVRASLLLVKEFAAQFAGDTGRVVLMTSGIHQGPMTRELEYAVSKGALHIATTSLADELAGRGITVNCVNPGPTDTGWGLGELDPSPRMPGGRWGEPDDAARLVVWLCSNDARWVTGQTIDSEGGFRR